MLSIAIVAALGLLFVVCFQMLDTLFSWVSSLGYEVFIGVGSFGFGFRRWAYGGGFPYLECVGWWLF